jgi:hypothetical protein
MRPRPQTNPVRSLREQGRFVIHEYQSTHDAFDRTVAATRNQVGRLALPEDFLPIDDPDRDMAAVSTGVGAAWLAPMASKAEDIIAEKLDLHHKLDLPDPELGLDVHLPFGSTALVLAEKYQLYKGVGELNLRHALGRRQLVRARHVPGVGVLLALPRARDTQVPADGGHLDPVGADRSPRYREPFWQGPPGLVLNLDAPGAGNDAQHDTAVTGDFWTSSPEPLRAHLACLIVDGLTPMWRIFADKRAPVRTTRSAMVWVGHLRGGGAEVLLWNGRRSTDDIRKSPRRDKW